MPNDSSVVSCNTDQADSSETKGKTLEEIAEVFGDDVAFTEYVGAPGDAVAQKHAGLEEAEADQIEHRSIGEK